MDSHKLVVKLFVENPSAVNGEEFVPVFHSWIQTHAVADHLLIDVADCEHVVDGPGTVLVSSEANFYTDREAGRLGLLYTRKLPLPGSLRDRIRSVFKTTLQSAKRLEDEATLKGKVKFRTDETIFRISDRLAAPNTPETYAAIKPDLDAVAKDIFGPTATLEHQAADPRRQFEVTIRSTGSSSVTDLLTRLG